MWQRLIRPVSHSPSIFAPPDYLDRLGRAAVASIVVVGIVWLGSNWNFSFDDLPIFHSGPFGPRTSLLLGVTVAVAVFLWPVRGFALLWVLLLLAYAWLCHQNSGYIDFIRPPTALQLIGATLSTTFMEQWSLLAGALLIATWVALFRDGRVGFAAIFLPAVAWVVVVASTYLVGAITWSLRGSGDVADVADPIWSMSEVLIFGGFPIALSAWEIVSIARAARSSPEVAAT